MRRGLTELGEGVGIVALYKRYKLVAVTIVLLIAGVILYRYWLARQSIGFRALSVAKAGFFGDFDEVMLHEPEDAAQAQGISKEKYAQVYQRLVKPYVHGWTIEQESYETQGGGALGTARLIARSPSGRQVEYGQNLWFTDAGPKDSSLWHLLNFSWRVRFADLAEGRTAHDAYRLRLHGLRADREFLESLGITGIPKRGGSTVTTWGEAIAKAESRISGEPPEELPPAQSK